MILKKIFGPSTLIAAAFIGPGTLTVCTIAGVEAGYDILWVLLFATITTIILQEMAARLGFYTRTGLGENIKSNFPHGIKRTIAVFLVLSAILIGNSAYEAGNITGGVLGAELLSGTSQYWAYGIGLLAFIILFKGNYKWIETFLITLVILMSLCFVITTIMVKPDLMAIERGFIPSGWDKHPMLILGLIGTTIVPYNLFLHASTISKKWGEGANIREIRIENTVSIAMGGLISMLIVITAAANQSQMSEVTSAKDLAIQLEPLFGEIAKWVMGVGLLAAGLSSALTAPLAAAYATKGILGWKEDEKGIRFRVVWMLVLFVGLIVISTGVKPIPLIQFAQAMNAILLPSIAGYLIYICNKESVLAKARNTKTQNTFAGIVLIITIVISIKTLVTIVNQL